MWSANLLTFLRRSISIIIITVINQGCEKLITVDAPSTSINAGNVFTTDETASATATAIYAQISQSNSTISGGGITSISVFAGLSADELTLYNLSHSTYYPFYTNNLTRNTTSGLFWNNIYPIIFNANSIIEGLNNNNTISAIVKSQLLGEAKFIRAFCYFYLVNLYDDVPKLVSTDYIITSTQPRTSDKDVLNLIVSDLLDAESLLSENYLSSDLKKITQERVRPTKWSAAALLARVYLYNGDWKSAENMATKVINENTRFKLTSLDNTFLKNSDEAIWQLQPVGSTTYSNTGDGAIFILPPSGPNSDNNPVYLSQELVNSFEPGDQRAIPGNWIDSIMVGATKYYYPYKYKIGLTNTPTAEYIMVLRLAEQYLIRSEARVNQNNIAGSKEDLNIVRNRAGLSSTNATSVEKLVEAILKERRAELFTEWGNRWFDLKRTNNIDPIMTNAAITKGGTWEKYKSLYPIPQSEIDLNPAIQQNNGY